MTGVDRSRVVTRLTRLGEGDDPYLDGLTPAERIELVWPLTLQAWGFKEGLADEPRLLRHVVRIIRGGR
jgi:hypothetical protein